MNNTMRKTGQSLIEVLVGITVLIPVALLMLDLTMIVWAVQSNDVLCRSAARAAANGNPAQATSRAQTVIDRARAGSLGRMISNFLLVSPVETKITGSPKSEIDVALEKQVNPGGPVSGSTTVTTEVEVKPFMVHMFYGKTSLRFRAQQTFPISYVMPPEV
jgi:hypothetical protein